MQTYELEITNELPLEFEGELLFEDSNHWTNGRDNNRWHELNIYRAVDEEDEYFIVWINWRTIWQGEESIAEFFTADSKDDIRSVLDEYDPIAYLIGYPDGDRYQDKQARLEQKLSFDWNRLKATALNNLGFKRESGRPRKNKKLRVNTTLTLDPKLKQVAVENQINLSELLNSTLSDLASEKGWL